MMFSITLSEQHLRQLRDVGRDPPKVVHHKGVTSRSRPLRVEYHKHKGMVRFYNKLLSERSRWLLALVTAGVWTRYAAIAAIHLISRGVKQLRGRSRSRP